MVVLLDQLEETVPAILGLLSNGSEAMPTTYSLSDVLERMYHNQLALEAALMELTLLAEKKGSIDVGDNVRGALESITENAGYIKQGLARLRGLDIG